MVADGLEPNSLRKIKDMKVVVAGVDVKERTGRKNEGRSSLSYKPRGRACNATFVVPYASADGAIHGFVNEAFLTNTGMHRNAAVHTNLEASR
jgi:hypothetical protein